MKKGSVKFCGIMTLIFSIIFIVIGVMFVGKTFNIEMINNLTNTSIVETIYNVAFAIFIFPLQNIFSTYLSLDSNLMQTILTVLFAFFSIVCFFWGIKEIAISRKDDEKFAMAKKRTGFASFIKFFFCLYLIGVVVCSFLLSDISEHIKNVNSQVGLEYATQIVCGVLFVLAFIFTIIPISAYKKAYGLFYNQNGNQYQDVQNNQMGYQDQYYNYQQTTPIDPNSLIVPEQVNQGDQFSLVPGQDGIPTNITQKGLEDLARLERLRASGAIDDRNYEALKQKICSTNLS